MLKHRTAYFRLVVLGEARARWEIPVFCLGEFIRIITHPRLLAPPYAPHEAGEEIQRVTASPSVTISRPGPDYEEFLLEAARESDTVRNLVFNFQIVALCREDGGSRLLTEDRDFDRFRGLIIERLLDGKMAMS